MFNWLRMGWDKLRSYVTSPLSGHGGTLLRGGGGSAAGQVVNPQTALALSAVYRAVRLYGEVHGTLPLGVYSKTGKRRQYYDTHPTHRVLHLQPNPEMTGMTFWPLMEAYRLLWGNAYAEIEWNGRAQCIGLWPLAPWRVVPMLDDDRQVIEFRVDGRRTVQKKDIVHLPNFSWCGTHGMSTIEFGVKSLGRALGAQDYGGKFFENGAVPRGLYKHPGRMEKPARDNFRKEMREENGKENSNSIGILWEGMEFQQVSMKPEDAQALETSKAGVLDICRWFNTPPQMLMELEFVKYATAEQGDLEFVKYGIIPLCTAWEQELNNKLLIWPDTYCKHSLEGLLRGDTAARMTWYKGMREIGVYSPNDILELEDMNPVGPEGDIRVVDGAYIPLSQLDAFWEAKSQAGTTHEVQNPESGPEKKSPDARTPPAPPSKGGESRSPKGSRKKTKLEEDPFFQSELARMERRERKALAKAAKRPGELLKWMDDFYLRHADVMVEVLTPAVSGFLELDDADPTVAEAVLSVVRTKVEASKAAILDAAGVPPDEFEAAMSALCSIGR